MHGAHNGQKGANEDQNHGITIALRAMEAPLREIVTNCGEEPSVVLNNVKQGTGSYGYNAASIAGLHQSSALARHRPLVSFTA